ncbi:MAG TPA: response regulator transcription factor [Actinomycetota bacterium]|nr:response regulator transcription factor [Actinomycetota bacterium]
MARRTILVVEDERNIADALEYQLVRDGFAVKRAADGRRALEVFDEGGVDLVVLDLMLPETSGEDVCRAIRRDSDVPIVMLTAKDAEVDKVLGLELGADDYVTKPFSTRELIARIRAILRRPRAAGHGGEVLHGGGITLDPDTREVTVRGEPVPMPRKEFELLEYMMARPSRVLRREVLLEDVWGFDFGGDSRTLDVHVKRLRAKCEENPASPERLVTVRGVGYKFVP